MNWTYGRSSRAARDSCTLNLITVMNEGLRRSPVDISIIWGFRGEDLQNSLFSSGASQKKWPESKHNTMKDGQPYAQAFDFAPYVNGIPWHDTHAFAMVAGVFFAVAAEFNIKLRWGGDWNMNGLTTDQTFMDWGHMEEVIT